MPREIAAVAQATGCTAFVTIPLAGQLPAAAAAFGFLLAAFPSKAGLSYT